MQAASGIDSVIGVFFDRVVQHMRKNAFEYHDLSQP